MGLIYVHFRPKLLFQVDAEKMKGKKRAFRFLKQYGLIHQSLEKTTPSSVPTISVAVIN